MPEQKKIAIVYDWIDKWGGVERVLLTLHEIFPKAQFYSSYFNPDTASWAKQIPIQTSFIQKLPAFFKKNRILSLILYPFAFESFDFSSYDLVISVTSSFAKSIITKPGTTHICYLLTPTRYFWSHEQEYFKDNFQKMISGPLRNYLRKWDFVAAQRPDRVISLSETVQKRCKKYYRRESQVLYPPFDIQHWHNIKSKILNPKSETKSKFQIPNSKYYLIVSRLEPYKKVDLAIKVFNKFSDKKLVVVGVGSLEKELKRIANKNIQLIPYLSDEELAQLYLNAEALIMPQEEDFGYVSLEAQYFGCPVIAFAKGGASETVVPDKTGLLFSSQSTESLREALEQFHTISYNLKASVKQYGPENVKRFDSEIFTKNILEIVNTIHI